jgi:hypothetical protein
LGACTSLVTTFLHLIKSVTHISHHKIHPLHHLRHGLHLERKFSLGMGWCVVLVWHDSTCKHWLVVKKNYPHITCVSLKLLLISSHAHTSRLPFLRFLRNWNQYQIKPTWQRNPNIYDSRSNKNEKTSKTKLWW